MPGEQPLPQRVCSSCLRRPADVGGRGGCPFTPSERLPFLGKKRDCGRWRAMPRSRPAAAVSQLEGLF
jgi:hypothetical protein